MTALRHPLVRLLLVLLVAGVLVAPVRIPYRVLWLAGFALAVTLAEARSLAPLGLTRHPLRATLLWALALAVFAAGVVGEGVEPLVERLIDAPADYSGYGAIAGNAPAALRMFGFALVSAALGEEIVARGFLLRQLAAVFGDGALARWAAILLAAAVFACAHWKQGPAGLVATGAIGVAMGWAWFRSGRNLPALILAHAATDAYGVMGLYLGRY